MTIAETISLRLEPLRSEMAGNPGLFNRFRQCFLNTAETTVQSAVPGDTFLITGDIDAMWLRDSTAQVLHYLRFADDPGVSGMIRGLIARQARCILIDPYANAFNQKNTGRHWAADEPIPDGRVWERKYETDSLCYPLLLASRWLEKTGDFSILTEEYHKALKLTIAVLKKEQNHAASKYFFLRKNVPPLDTLSHEGRGAPVAPCGMTWSGFRPSDDACTYGYLIPSNLFAACLMPSAVRIAKAMKDEPLAESSELLGQEITEGVNRWGKIQDEDFGEIYAYEVDAMGHYVLMDDANVPSLLSLPYLGVCNKTDPVYLRTRAMILSRKNPFYSAGRKASGIGSPHTPAGHIWPISLCMQIMTGAENLEAARLLHTLLTTDAGTGYMHESFHPDHPEIYTRAWFAWANSLFGDMIYRLHEEGRLKTVLDLMGRIGDGSSVLSSSAPAHQEL